MNKAQRDALEEYKANAGSIYKNKVASAYNMDSRKVFTGENLYEVIRDKLLGREADRELIHDFELFISKNFYDGEDFSIIPIIEQGYLNVKIGDTEERALHNLGDGIKQLICILYKAFEMKDNEAFIFIEEPEINLHPGYQRKLLDVLQQEEFSNLYFFITTHSNHFVDRYFDYNNISLFKFINVNKNNNKFQVISTSPYDISLLNCLGVNNSSVFMANATIWVEGLSDKIYIKKYLDVYSKEEGRRQYKEGVDYSFVEYGGNNITHWDFGDGVEDERLKSSAITNRAMIILDNDDDKKKKRKDRLKNVFEKRYCELTVREIENTISIPVLEKMLFPEGEVKYKTDKDRSKKRLNTKSARLWEYIDRNYCLEKRFWDSRNNKAKVNKIDFAKLICNNIASVDDLSDEAKCLCENIYNFLGKTYKDINE